MASEFVPEFAVHAIRGIVVELVRRRGESLTSHQLGVFLTCYLDDADHTVRGLAERLNVSKSVITRALDRLGELRLAARKPDPNDARSIFVARTPEGLAMIDDLRQIAGRQAFRLQGPSLLTV